MPLPFSFSTQRHSFDSETAGGTGGAVVLEAVMQQAPGVISTEPLLGTPGSTFTRPPTADLAASAERAAAIAALFPPAPSPNQRPVLSAEPPWHPVLLGDTLTLPPPAPVAQAPSTPLLQPQPEWTAQMEQLRNDIFGIAMSVSALNDRIDRLDQRAPQAGAGLATLRAEIESWLESHLNAAVEHCMHRIASRAPIPAAPPPAPAAD